MRAVVSTPRRPIVYTPRIVVIAQGHKRVYLGDKTFVYDPDHLLVLSVPMTLERETTASPEQPLLGLSIGELDVASLAQEANMGVSTFHHAFRDATATSPVQYLKRIRLHKARALLLTDGLNAQHAARRFGYAGPPQFSREYRRMFGTSPSLERVALSA